MGCGVGGIGAGSASEVLRTPGMECTAGVGIVQEYGIVAHHTRSRFESR